MYTEIKEAEAFNRPYHSRVSDTLGADRFRKIQVDLTDLRKQVELVRGNLQETNFFRLNKSSEGTYTSDESLGNDYEGLKKTYEMQRDDLGNVNRFTNETSVSGNRTFNIIDGEVGSIQQIKIVSGNMEEVGINGEAIWRLVSGKFNYSEETSDIKYQRRLIANTGIGKEEILTPISWTKSVTFGFNDVIKLVASNDRKINRTGFVEITTKDRADKSFQEDYGVVYKKPIVDYIASNYVTKTEFEKYKKDTNETLIRLQESIIALQPE